MLTSLYTSKDQLDLWGEPEQLCFKVMYVHHTNDWGSLAPINTVRVCDDPLPNKETNFDNSILYYRATQLRVPVHITAQS